MKTQKSFPKKKFKYPNQWPPTGSKVKGTFHVYLGFGGFTTYGTFKVKEDGLINSEGILISKSMIKRASLEEV